jgi:myo-inositol-1(or 4)-monophosphatase
VRWVIDPLDGTTNFVYGFPVYAVSLAAEVDGEVVVGVVIDVAREVTYRAVLGGGAFADDRPLRVGDPATLSTALIGTGFSYDAEVRRRQAEVLPVVLPAVRDIRRSGAAALDLCLLAAGHLDGFWERGLAPWDRAAGGLIAAEAGATVALHGPAAAPTLVAAAPSIHDALLALIAGTDGIF